MLGFTAAGLVFTYAIERLQALCLSTRKGWPASAPISHEHRRQFCHQHHWQFYTPESTMSYLTQMLGLATHNFSSAAAGIVVAVALIRGIKRTTSRTIGNFWVDMTRTTLYVLIPGSFIYALLLVAQGVPQNFSKYTVAHPLEQPVAGANDRPRPGRLTGSHQDARHQRRRILQRQQRSSLREPHAVLQLPPDPFHLHHSRRTHLHARPHDRLPGHGWAVFAAMFVLFAAGFTPSTGPSRSLTP